MSDKTSPMLGRRHTLTWLAGALLAPKALAQATGSSPPITPFAPVVAGYVMQFPRDGGSHPDFRIEWWYVTGWLNATSTHPLGFQVTFFRGRPHLRQDNPSAFTPRQIIFAHAALSDPRVGRLVHTQRAARAVFGLAGAARDETRVWLDDWALERRNGSYRARIPAGKLQMDLTLTPSQSPLLEGVRGLSRKGPAPESASYYYSEPHLKVTGTVSADGHPLPATGSAWLDHEWSSSYLPEQASGWDWIGINLVDGGALMAFRMRKKGGGQVWAGGTWRRADGSIEVFAPSDIHFTPRREWRSPRTGTRYPVSWSVRAGKLELAVEPLMDDQENDTRLSTGTIYWEGAVRVYRNGAVAGLGYLELTGYWRPMSL